MTDLTLADLTEVVKALERARSAYEKGLDDEYVWCVHFAHGRLTRIVERLTRPQTLRPISDWKEAKG